MNNFILKDAYYDRIKEALSNPAKEKELFRHIAYYRNKNIDILSSPYIEKMMPFATADFNVIFDVTGIDEDEVKEVMKTVPLPGIKAEKKNLTPFTLLMVLILKYYIELNDESKLRLIYLYYSYSLYFSLYTKFFPAFKPKIEVMKYTINNITNKFILKQTGSLEKSILHATQGAVENLREDILNASDKDILRAISDIKTRNRNFMSNVSSAYYKDVENKNIMFSQTEQNEEDQTFIERSSTMGIVESLADEYTTAFFSSDPSEKTISMCANICSISASELRTALSLLIQNDKINEVKKFYSCLFYLYFSKDSKRTAKSVKSMKFVSEIDSIYKKGNSIDKNIITIKKLTDKWLVDGTTTYRTTDRQATKNSFRKAIYLYFSLLVASNE